MSTQHRIATLAACAVAGSALTGLALSHATAAPDGSGLVISEAYVNGGSAGATFSNKFVEVYNPTSAAIDLTGYSLQYRSPTGTAAATGVVPLSGTVAPGDYFVLQGDSNGANGSALPSPDQTSSLNPGGGGGTLFLANATSAVDPDPADAQGAVVDLVGWGSSNLAETTPTSGNSVTASHQRITAEDVVNRDSDDNANDFDALAPTPGAGLGPTTPEPVEPTPLSIEQIQGTGATSPHVGTTVLTSGVVTAAYPSGGLYGFYLQVPGSGGELDLSVHTASRGIFVYQAQGAGPVTVRPGDHVQVTGAVSEYAGATQLTVATAGAIVPLAGSAPAPVAATSAWPATAAQKESLEGMLYRPQGDFTVNNTYYGSKAGQADSRYGEVGLAQGTTPLIQPTEVADAQDAAAIAAVVADNEARAIVLDDGSSVSFAGKGDLTPAYVSQQEPVTVGARVEFTEPVIFTQGGAPSAPSYRFQPTSPVLGPDNAASPATFENVRSSGPDQARIAADGEPGLKVASFNVLNYFTTLGDADDDNIGDGGCVAYRDRDGDGNNVDDGCAQRGAWDPADLTRQQAKIVKAINALDADVVGLMEIENSAALGEQADEATQSLVAALNADAGAGTWAANPSSAQLPPVAEQDVITNAIIYRPDAVTRVGDAVALGDQSSGTGAFSNAREPIGQVFEPVGGGEQFLYVVNHFKSKGSGVDDGTGQGNANPDRIRQAEALRDWVATQQQASGVGPVLLGGDFNAYTQEDPLQVLYAAGFVDATEKFGGDEWSYVFDGLSGSLDHILLNPAAAALATGSDVWNINAGESILFEYSRWNYHATDFHADTPYRSSDHDPVVVGLDLGGEASAIATTTSLKVAPSRVRVGRSATAIVRVRAEEGARPGGTVEIRNGSTVLATATLRRGGVAVVRLPRFTAPGRLHLSAVYLGDATHDGSTSSLVGVTVHPAKHHKHGKRGHGRP
ncbi:ExeM/NucH family extracellular endonuclease [Nocardioides dubius]|uniref:LTD domain-containing protein n=1 Tax=Nocardioides dubius TaxID=317019 RepID=A0ABP4EJU0_9ACTN